MSIKVQDILNINVVFNGIELLNTPASLKKFETFVDSEIVINEGTDVSINPHGSVSLKARTITIQKDRVFVDCSQARSIAQRDYPSSPGDLARLADIVSHAYSCTEHTKTPANFGLNLDMVCNQNSGRSASGYIAHNILSHSLLENKRIIGGSGAFTFLDEQQKQWAIRIEPRFKDLKTTKVFISLNLHFNEPRIPNNNEIRTFLDQIWDRALNIGEWIE